MRKKIEASLKANLKSSVARAFANESRE